MKKEPYCETDERVIKDRDKEALRGQTETYKERYKQKQVREKHPEREKHPDRERERERERETKRSLPRKREREPY